MYATLPLFNALVMYFIYLVQAMSLDGKDTNLLVDYILKVFY